MILERYYIISIDMWSSTGDAVTSGVLAVSTKVINRESLIALYQAINEKPVAHRFCLFLEIAGTPDIRLANDLVAFFFFPNYEKSRGRPEVILHSDKYYDAEPFVSAIKEAAQDQGFYQLKVHYVRSGNEGAGIYVHSSNKEKDIKETYRSVLVNPVISTTHLFIKMEQPSDIKRVDRFLVDEEAAFQHQEPILYQLWLQNKALQARVLKLALREIAAQQEIDSQSAHIKLLRLESQATHLQNYYTNEYEVLPSWYKRFGHVLKVIIGKRSFRSLFNDNVKKYKQ